MPGLILDLDQTLIDSSCAEIMRRNRQWPAVYSQIPQFGVYTGMDQLLAYIRMEAIKVCIVTTSPDSYCRRVLSHWAIPYDYTVCYHDVRHRKPHPESMLRALQLMRERPENVLSLGDRAIDIVAARAAGIKSVACMWGTSERNALMSLAPEYIAVNPLEALSIVQSEL